MSTNTLSRNESAGTNPSTDAEPTRSHRERELAQLDIAYQTGTLTYTEYREAVMTVAGFTRGDRL